MSTTENPEQQNPEQQNPGQQNPEQQNLEQQNPEQKNPEQKNPEQKNPGQQNLEQQNREQQNPGQQIPEQKNPWLELYRKMKVHVQRTDMVNPFFEHFIKVVYNEQPLPSKYYVYEIKYTLGDRKDVESLVTWLDSGADRLSNGAIQKYLYWFKHKMGNKETINIGDCCSDGDDCRCDPIPPNSKVIVEPTYHGQGTTIMKWHTTQKLFVCVSYDGAFVRNIRKTIRRFYHDPSKRPSESDSDFVYPDAN
jgi:hypothetical protein